MRRVAVAVVLLALGLLGWLLTSFSEQRQEPSGQDHPEADHPPPGLKTAESERPTGSGRTLTPADAAAVDANTGVSKRQRYVIHIHGPAGALTGAQVLLLRGDATEKLPPTGSDGTTTVELASLDGVMLAVSKHGYRGDSWAPYQGDLWVADDVQHVRLKLERGVPIRGRVVDARTGAPIKDARGTVNDWGLNIVPIGPTDAEGWFTHPGVMDDNEARIAVSAPGYATTTIQVFADSGRLRPEVPVVKLEVGGQLTGAVLQPDGRPAAGATVRVVTLGRWRRPRNTPPLDEKNRADFVENYQYSDEILRDRQHSISVRTAADGTFVADGLRFGTSYWASASAAGFAASPETPAMKIDATNVAPEVVLRLRASGRVQLRLTAEEAVVWGRPRVRLFHRDALVRPVSGTGAGPYEFVDLVPGRYHVWAQVGGLLPALGEVVLAEGESHVIELAIDSGVEVEGVVVDVDGKPLPGMEVQAARAADNPRPTGMWLHQEREARSDSAGRFRIGGLLTGDSVLIASGYVEGRGWFATRKALRFTPPARGLRVVVKPMGKVTMRLMKPDGTPFSGELWATEDGSGGSCEITDGRHEEGMMQEGVHHLVVAPSGYAWFHRTVTIEDGNTVAWGEITLEPGTTVSGRTVDGDGRPVKGATITCTIWDHRTTQTDAEGRFALDRFPKERLAFRIEAEGFVTTTRRLQTGQPGLRVVLQRPAIVAGTLASARGPAPHDTWIELRPVGAKLIKEWLPGPDGEEQEWSYWEGVEGLSVDEGRLSGQVAPGTYDAFWRPEEGDPIRLGRFTFVEGENAGVRMVIPAKNGAK